MSEISQFGSKYVINISSDGENKLLIWPDYRRPVSHTIVSGIYGCAFEECTVLN